MPKREVTKSALWTRVTARAAAEMMSESAEPEVFPSLREHVAGSPQLSSALAAVELVGRDIAYSAARDLWVDLKPVTYFARLAGQRMLGTAPSEAEATKTRDELIEDWRKRVTAYTDAAKADLR